jgi:hypothetical protein
MIPRECHCGHVMLEHEYNGRCLVTVCGCKRYDEKVADEKPRVGGKPKDRTTVDQ